MAKWPFTIVDTISDMDLYVITKLLVVGYILVVSIHPASFACRLLAVALPIYHDQSPIVSISIQSLSKLLAS
jgi:hypothetical protein